jgi:hypothetical protein
MMESATNHPRVDSFSSSETFDYENEDDDEGKNRWFVPPFSTTGVGL